MSESEDRAFGDRIARLWWAAPVTIVAIGAIGASIVVAPTLGRRAGVPSGLSVPMHPIATARPTPSAPAATPKRHRPTPSVSPKPSAVVSASPPASIVVPQRPLVTSSPEGHDDGAGHGPGDR